MQGPGLPCESWLGDVDSLTKVWAAALTVHCRRERGCQCWRASLGAGFGDNCERHIRITTGTQMESLGRSSEW